MAEAPLSSDTGRVRQDPKGCVGQGHAATVHGFRSAFREWAAEQTSVPAAVCGLALAHVKKDRVEAAYQRSDFFERRRALMQAWAHYVSAVDHSVHVHQYA